MDKKKSIIDNQEGFVLVFAMLAMLILVFIGVMTSRRSNLDVKISATEKKHTEAFHRADGVIDLVIATAIENIYCMPSGFIANAVSSVDGVTPMGRLVPDPSPGDGLQHSFPVLPGTSISGETLMIENASLDFSSIPVLQTPSDTTRDLYIPADYVGDNPHTNVALRTTNITMAGSSLQMVSGYEGIGYGSTGGAVAKRVQIRTNGVSSLNSQSNVAVDFVYCPIPGTLPACDAGTFRNL